MSALPIPARGIVISHCEVLPAWLDYNQHMNVAYYLVAFELGIDDYKAIVGLDLAYIERELRSTVALESHITFQNEASLGEKLRVETRIIDFDGKRAHIYQELFRGETLLATQETLSISFDLKARRSAPFEAHIATGYRELMAAQANLERPKWVGRSIGIGKGKPGQSVS
jgi:acyl-CoA thioester hydrolase